MASCWRFAVGVLLMARAKQRPLDLLHRSATLGTELLADTLGSIALPLVSLARAGSAVVLAVGLVALQLLLLGAFAYTRNRWFGAAATVGKRVTEADDVELVPLGAEGRDFEGPKRSGKRNAEEFVDLGTLAKSWVREHYWLGSACVVHASATVAAVALT
jgi:hypothetical protein